MYYLQTCIKTSGGTEVNGLLRMTSSAVDPSTSISFLNLSADFPIAFLFFSTGKKAIIVTSVSHSTGVGFRFTPTAPSASLCLFARLRVIISARWLDVYLDMQDRVRTMPAWKMICVKKN